MNRIKANLKFFSQGTGVIDLYVFNRIGATLLDFFKKIHPTAITFFSLILVIINFLLVINGYLLIGTGLYLVGFSILDQLDGAIARKFDKKSLFGGIFDGFVDIIAETSILIAVGFYYSQIILFGGLAILIMLVTIFNLRYKWLSGDKDRQIDYRDEKNIFKLIVILATRNDTRRMILMVLSYYKLINILIIYWVTIYLINFIYSIKNAVLGKK